MGILQKISFDDVSNRISFIFRGSKSVVIDSTAVIPAGTVLSFSGATVPAGYILCDGRAVSRSLFSSLFANIGTASGSGDGSTTFNIPDLRGRFIRGVDGTAGNDPDKTSRTAMNPGGNTGNNVGSIQTNATAKNGLANANSAVPIARSDWNLSGQGDHTHSVTAYDDERDPDINWVGRALGGTLTLTTPAGQGTHSHSWTSTGSYTAAAQTITGDSETRPVNAYVNYIIKT